MHAVLLSGSLGMGHDVMAEACATSLERRGWSTETLDSLKLLGPRSGGLGERVFRGMLAVPGAYDAFHFEQLRAGGRLAGLAERASSKYAVPALEDALRRRPADLVISVFATGAAAASRVKGNHPGLRTVVFCTDTNPHRMWVHENTDLYLVTSVTSRGFVRRFHPRARVAIVPAPARPPFYSAPDRAAARDELGVPAGARCALLMAGSWGMGPLREAAQALAAAGITVLAVAGRNAELEASLLAASAAEPRIVPFGFTDRVPTLMAAADLVITSSGDTCSEARVIGRPLLLLDVVPGHGRENLQQELARGNADVAPVDPRGLCEAAVACFERLAAEPPPPRSPATADAWEDAFAAALAELGLGGRAGSA